MDLDEQVGDSEGELVLRWFRVKDDPNATLHVIKETQKPTSQVVDSARFHITEDVNWEAARLEKEAAEVAGWEVEGRHVLLSRAVESVAKYYHISVATVNKMRRAVAEKGSPTRKTCSGRPPVYGKDAKVLIVQALNLGNGRTIAQAQTGLEESFPLVTTTTRKGHVRHSPSHGTIAKVKLEGKKIGVPRRPVCLCSACNLV
jgi:hypothetical protein